MVREVLACQQSCHVLHTLRATFFSGDRVIIQREDPETRVEEFTFEPHQAYALDICFSTGDGKTREMDSRTTVFKRDPESRYLLKVRRMPLSVLAIASSFHALCGFSFHR
jgi:hypothetical protein